jgi:hypothetical protein
MDSAKETGSMLSVYSRQEFDPFLLLLQLALGAMVGLKDGCSVLE